MGTGLAIHSSLGSYKATGFTQFSNIAISPPLDNEPFELKIYLLSMHLSSVLAVLVSIASMFALASPVPDIAPGKFAVHSEGIYSPAFFLLWLDALDANCRLEKDGSICI